MSRTERQIHRARLVRPNQAAAIAAVTLAGLLVPVAGSSAQPGANPPGANPPTTSSRQTPADGRRERRAAALEVLAAELGRPVDEVRAAARAARAEVDATADRRTRRRQFVGALARALDATPDEVRSALRAARSARVTVR